VLPSGAPDGEMALGPDQVAGLGGADGLLPAGTTAFDTAFPGIANLDRQLLAAVLRATTAAAGRKIDILVSSGWRSWAYQSQLFDQAVARYGSPASAARWVAPLGTSAHETGTRSTSGLLLPCPGCQPTAPDTASARSTATSPGITN
jgi:D-alanyl-D-alanine carboxypeptidase